jgi:hypothetical protein
MNMKNFLYYLIELLLLIVIATIITWLSIRIPLDGPQISGTINCGFPSGLPFSFIGTWKYLSGPPQPLCALGFDLIGLILDIAFWIGAIYLILYFVKKLAGRFRITLDKGRIIAILIILASLFFIILLRVAYAQSINKFDLENLRKQNSLLTKAYDIIQIQKAWEEVIKSNLTLFSTVVGIIDTGIDPGHQEFNTPEVNLGLFPRSILLDFKDGGHGTQVAGIIGANNASRVTTLPPDSPQMNGILSGILNENKYTLEIRPATGQVQISVFAAIESAIRHNARSINMSFGVANCSALSIVMRALVNQECYKTDQEFIDAFDSYKRLFQQAPSVLFIAGAGNNDIDASLSLPGALSLLGNVMAIGATDLDDKRAEFTFPEKSNFGNAVSISAPGKNVYAPKPDNRYDQNFSGTSASAPMVTGVAGLIKAIKPELTPAQIKQILIETGDPISTDKPIGPRLNAYKAVCHSSVLNCAPPPPCVLSGTLTSDTTLASGQTCTIQGGLTIPNGITLTINPGVVLKFASPSPYSKITINGTLNANGTASQPIYFTSIKDDSVGGDTNNDGSATSPAPWDWQDITINSTGAANFNYTTIRYGNFFYLSGGNLSLSHSHLTQNVSGLRIYSGAANIISSELDHSYAGIVQFGGTVTVNQSSIHDNTTDGIYASAGALTLINTNFQNNDRALFLTPSVDFTHSGNTAANNNINGIGMSGVTIADRTWTKDLIPYVIYSEKATGTVTISSGTTLTIDPGTVIKFAFSYSRFIVNGTLNANGTASQTIYFTSIKDDSVGGDTNNDGSATSPAPWDWADITINSTGTANFNYTTIRYGNFFYLSGGNLSLSHSHLTQNVSGLRIYSGAANIISSELDHSYAGIVQFGGTVTVNQSSIHDNSPYGAYAVGSPTPMDARNNWWGSVTGPYHPTLNPGGLGNPISDNVDFLPFLTSDPVGSLP